jgi:hypothetical protein
VLRYKQTDIEGRQAPVPTRLQPEPPPAGIMAAASRSATIYSRSWGIFDPSQLPTGNISGKALNGQQQQVDMTNYHYYDNLTKSIAQTGRIILDLIPKIYDSERVMRIIGVDGKPDLITINEATQVGRAAERRHGRRVRRQHGHGPGLCQQRMSSSRRNDAVDRLEPSCSRQQAIWCFGKWTSPVPRLSQTDWQRLTHCAQIDEKSDIPPQVQMQLAQAKQQMQMMQQQMQAMQLEDSKPWQGRADQRGRSNQAQADGSYRKSAQHRDHGRS